MIKNRYYIAPRIKLLNVAADALKNDLQNKKLSKEDKEFYSFDELKTEIKDIKNIMPITDGEWHHICNVAGVEYIKD